MFSFLKKLKFNLIILLFFKYIMFWLEMSRFLLGRSFGWANLLSQKNRPLFLLTDRFSFCRQKKPDFLFLALLAKKSGIWDFCPKTPTFPCRSSWFSSRDFSIAFPILLLPTLVLPSASGRRRHRQNPRKSLWDLRFSFFHRPPSAARWGRVCKSPVGSFS